VLSTSELVGQLESPSFWRKQFPSLTVGKALKRAKSAPEDLQLAATRVRTDGYGQGSDPTLARQVKPLAAAVKRCMKLGIPPAFIFLFDQTWACFHGRHALLKHVLGDEYRIVPDAWVWHVDPKADEAGWAPHRDLGRISLNADGTPKTLQIWIPLVEATPLNGCMYVLPAPCDPRYGTEQDMQFTYDIAGIRALPARPGDYLFWNGAVIHWGAKSSRFGTHPRISMAVKHQRGDIPPYNAPLMEPGQTADFKTRLTLVAKQLFQFRQRYPLPLELENAVRELARPITQFAAG
jgi:Phytanoyl-CoA dioxygenase (PhyH)